MASNLSARSARAVQVPADDRDTFQHISAPVKRILDRLAKLPRVPE